MTPLTSPYSVRDVITHGELRIEPPAEILDAARAWIASVRPALGHEFLSAYLTGSVLSQGFDAEKSRVNLLIVARTLGMGELTAIHDALPTSKKPPHFEPLFLTRSQIEKSLDVFPIEWLEIQERHLLMEGDDVFATVQVPRTYLRLQCEHELRGKHIRLRQGYLTSGKDTVVLERLLRESASSFATLFRTLLRLSGESPPANTAHVIERVADLFEVDAQGLLVAHLVRYAGKRHTHEELSALYRKFLGEVDRLVVAIDRLQVA